MIRLKWTVRFACFCQWYTDSKMTWLRGHLVNCTMLPVCSILGNEIGARGLVIHASHIMKNKLSKLSLLLASCFFVLCPLSVCKWFIMYTKTLCISVHEIYSKWVWRWLAGRNRGWRAYCSYLLHICTVTGLFLLNNLACHLDKSLIDCECHTNMILQCYQQALITKLHWIHVQVYG